MTGTDHYTDELQELLDGRLSAEQTAEVRAHLDVCSRCRAEYDALGWVKRAAAAAGAQDEISVPANLEDATRRALDREDARQAGSPRLHRRHLMVAAAAVLSLAAVGLTWWIGRIRGDLVTAVQRDYAGVRSGGIPLDVLTASAQELEAYFARQGIDFRTRVLDLAMMGYRITGGRVHALADRTSAMFVYVGPAGRTLVCQMFPGVIGELPPPAEVRSHRGFDFYVYRRDGTTLVFWQEGEVVCVLAGDFASEEIVALAFEKAMV